MNISQYLHFDEMVFNNLKLEIPRVIQLHKEDWLSGRSEIKDGHFDDQILRVVRDVKEHPALMMKKTTKVRTCQNMSGVLGGANAFNFLSFVAGVITLIVNVNNNVNNNNNNLNGVSANANNNQNNNANVNNNAANVILAMPGRKRKRRSDDPSSGTKNPKRSNKMIQIPITIMKAMADLDRKVTEGSCSITDKNLCNSLQQLKEQLGLLE